MTDTDHFRRFYGVSSVMETEHGLQAELHDEKLSIDVVRPNVIRVTISRGGDFDPQPTFAVCVDPLAEHTPFQIDRDADLVRLLHIRSSRDPGPRPVPTRRAPHRRQRRRTDGAGREWSALGVRHTQ